MVTDMEPLPRWQALASADGACVSAGPGEGSACGERRPARRAPHMKSASSPSSDQTRPYPNPTLT